MEKRLEKLELPGLHRKYLIKRLLRHPTFCGVFEFKELRWRKFPRRYPLSLIILDDVHFTSLVISNPKTCFYFDSCGNETIEENVKLFNFVRSLGLKTIVYNAKQIQSSCSDKCGLYCLYFILQHVITLEKYQQFLDHFRPGCCSSNESIIKALLQLTVNIE